MELNKKNFLRLLLLVVAGVVLYWITCEMDKVASIIGSVAKIFSPFVAGMIIAFILNVPMRGFERLLRGVKNTSARRAIAILLTLLSVLIVLTAVFLLLIPQLIVAIIQLFTSLGDFPDWISTGVKNLLDDYPEIGQWISANVDLGALNWGSLVQNLVTKLGDFISNTFTQVFGMLGTVASGVVNAFLAVVFSIYCLFNKDTLARQGRKILYAYFPERFSDRVVRVLRLSNVTFSNFLSGQCVEACILGGLFALVMFIFGMPYIPLISVLIAVTAFIPIVGALIGCFVGAFLIAVTEGPLLAINFVIISVILQQIENNLIYPRVVGTSIGMPGMWVLVAVSVGGAIMGVGGMFLMIPLSSVLYAIVRIYTNKRLKNLDVSEDKLKCHPISFHKGLIKKKQKKNKTDGTVPNQEDSE